MAEFIGSEFISRHLAAADLIETRLDAFARALTNELGAPVPDKFLFEEFYLIGTDDISVNFVWSTQCGDDRQYVRFPLNILDDATACHFYVVEKRAEMKADAEARAAKFLAAEENVERAEYDRLHAKYGKAA